MKYFRNLWCIREDLGGNLQRQGSAYLTAKHDMTWPGSLLDGAPVPHSQTHDVAQQPA
jgi:hypothetical protein